MDLTRLEHLDTALSTLGTLIEARPAAGALSPRGRNKRVKPGSMPLPAAPLFEPAAKPAEKPEKPVGAQARAAAAPEAPAAPTLTPAAATKPRKPTALREPGIKKLADPGFEHNTLADIDVPAADKSLAHMGVELKDLDALLAKASALIKLAQRKQPPIEPVQNTKKLMLKQTDAVAKAANELGKALDA